MKIYADILSIVGFVGVLCSVKLICGVKRRKPGKLLWWIVFQWTSIIFQFFVSIQLIEIIAKSADTKNFGFASSIFVFTYAIVEIYFLFSAMILFVSYRNCENVDDDQAQQSMILQVRDKPPSYDEAVNRLV